MGNNKAPTYKVLVSNTTPLFDLIKELSFKEEKPEGWGMTRIRKFKKGDKYIHSSHYYVLLFKLNSKTGKRIVIHNSLTIHDEDLKFFAKRDPIEIKNR